MPRKKSDPTGPADKPGKTPRTSRVRASSAHDPVKGPEKDAPSSRLKSRTGGKEAQPEAKTLTPARRTATRHTLKSAVLEKSGRSWELPTRYGETKAVLLARDPYWIYAYWEITADKQNAAKTHLGDEHPRSGTVLRVFQSPGPEGGEPRFLYDVEVRPFITSWYLNVHRPDSDYYVEIVQRSPSGRIFVLARSNTVTTPRDFATPSPEKKWRVPDSLAKYFRKETRSQQTGVSSAQAAEGLPIERFPSGKGP
jgi:hypothetical protein